jgi:RNA polymerase sigma-70 factor (ECF subfamily)
MQALADRMGEMEPAMVELLDEAQRGDVAAFEALYRRHVGRVHALCWRLAGDAGRAEELTQEVFLRAWKHLGTCPNGDALAGWLCQLAIHVVLSDNRKLRRRFRRESPSVDGILQDRGSAPGTPGLALDLERAIARLPPGAKQVFVLHDVEGFRHEEIGKLLGLSAGTSKAQLHRARRLLKEALKS